MHRLRGVLGTAITWALIWLPIGVATALLPQRQVECLYCAPFWEWFPKFALMWTLWGAVSGGIFAIVLMFAERRRTLAELSMARIAVWGAVGSLALPAALMVRDGLVTGVPLALIAALGAACAAGTLRIARRAAMIGS